MTDAWVREEAARQVANWDGYRQGGIPLAEFCLRAGLAHQAKAVRELRAALKCRMGGCLCVNWDVPYSCDWCAKDKALLARYSETDEKGRV